MAVAAVLLGTWFLGCLLLPWLLTGPLGPRKRLLDVPDDVLLALNRECPGAAEVQVYRCERLPWPVTGAAGQTWGGKAIYLKGPFDVDPEWRTRQDYSLLAHEFWHARRQFAPWGPLWLHAHSLLWPFWERAAYAHGGAAPDAAGLHEGHMH